MFVLDNGSVQKQHLPVCGQNTRFLQGKYLQFYTLYVQTSRHTSRYLTLINILLGCSLITVSLKARRTIHETKDSQYVGLYDIQNLC